MEIFDLKLQMVGVSSFCYSLYFNRHKFTKVREIMLSLFLVRLT